MSNSPLGKYAAPAAAIAALAIIGAWVSSEIGYAAGWFATYPAGLKEAALLALGSVFGSAVAVNGVKAPINSAHKRLDVIGAPHVEDSEAV